MRRIALAAVVVAAAATVSAAVSVGAQSTGQSRPARPAAAGAAAAPLPPMTAPLIPRRAFFGNPTRTQGRISPDGRWISWIAPRDGVLNIFVAPADRPDEGRPLTNERTRPIRQHFWAPDSSMVMFINDRGGDENFLLYGVNVAGGEARALTPFERTRVQIVNISHAVPDRILIGVNNRDPRWHDVHSLNLRTGQLTPVFQNTGEYAGFLADEQLNLRAAIKARPDGGQDVYRITNNQVEAQPFETVGFEDSQTTSPVGFTTDGSTLYWIDSRNRDTAALVAQDVASGRRTVLAQDERADISGALTNPRTGVVEAYAVNYLRNEWTPVGDAIRADLEYLRAELPGQFGVSARSDDDRTWIVAVDPVTAPAAVYRYDREPRRLTRLFVTRPELENQPLVAMHPVEIRTGDGMTLVSYLSLPPGSDANNDGRPERPVPLVLNVHGGPWARDGYGYHPEHQWLANRGYAVLSVNYRGSTGFGKRFISAGDREWGGRMHQDLIDAVDWAAREGITTREQTAIYGGSYGGYATLAGLTFTPERFACGVNIVGVSNLNTFMNTIPPYWEAFRPQLYRRVGDPRTPEGREFLASRSPVNRADQIVRPLLIAQGANDPRVNKAESDQIVAAMRQRNIPVTYVVYPDEGHGFARPENNMAFYATAEAFLGRCLGGRAEPFGEVLNPSSITVEAGADIVPGLADALRSRPAPAAASAAPAR